MIPGTNQMTTYVASALRTDEGRKHLYEMAQRLTELGKSLNEMVCLVYEGFTDPESPQAHADVEAWVAKMDAQTKKAQ